MTNWWREAISQKAKWYAKINLQFSIQNFCSSQLFKIFASPCSHYHLSVCNSNRSIHCQAINRVSLSDVMLYWDWRESKVHHTYWLILKCCCRWNIWQKMGVLWMCKTNLNMADVQNWIYPVYRQWRDIKHPLSSTHCKPHRTHHIVCSYQFWTHDTSAYKPHFYFFKAKLPLIFIRYLNDFVK